MRVKKVRKRAEIPTSLFSPSFPALACHRYFGLTQMQIVWSGPGSLAGFPSLRRKSGVPVQTVEGSSHLPISAKQNKTKQWGIKHEHRVRSTCEQNIVVWNAEIATLSNVNIDGS
jgi:hypothetical protein